ncbi:MAG TPA: hypothetical protein ENH20_00165 [Candidatus Pacearchaeota archaeon]|nr:hypothetical protein [Candidatus Pacearchaeota archaeon]
MKEIDNILRILREMKRFVEEDRANELKSLSNQTIHAATISQDADNIVVAVLVYSIGKVMERDHYRSMEGWDDFYGAVVKNLGLAAKALEKEDIKSARVYLGRIRNSLNKIEGDLGRYIKDVFRKAEINKAFKLYEHGLSSEATAELLGVSLWDLASYIGQSHIGNSKIAISMPVRERVKIAEEMFNA